MKPSSYWQKRFEHLKRDELLATNGSLEKTRALYAKIEKSIEKDLAYWYRRYMRNNEGTSYADAQKALTKKELAEFRWSLEEYIEKAKTFGDNSKWHSVLENASIKAHVTRLELLQLQLKHHSEVLHDALNKNLNKDLRKIYEGQYYKNLFELQKGLEKGRLIEKVDASFLDLVIHKPWHKDGLDFSSRIWRARDKLVSTLERELTYIAIRGDSPDGAIRRISQLFGKSRSHSAMLIQTEHAAIASRAQQDAFKALDVEQFEYIATLDGKTSELCQSMDGKHFPMSEYQVGLTAPPLHPRCRSCTAPYFEDMEAPRWARDKDGKGYVIGEGVKFKDWEEEYIVSDLDDKGNKAQEEKQTIEVEDEKDAIPKLSWKNFNEIEEHLIKDTEPWLKTLSYDKIDAFKYYTAEGYIDINNFVRHGHWFDEEIEEMLWDTCALLNEGLNKFELTEDISVLRGMSSEIIRRYDINLNNIVGERFTDIGYMSATIDVNTAKQFSKMSIIDYGGEPVLIQFDIPKGKKRGAYLEAISKNKEEYEFLIPPESTFEFYEKTIEDETGILLLKARLVE